MNGMETFLAGSPLIAVAAAFAGGIFTGLAPCVYMMIPIVSAYVGARAAGERALCPHCTPAFLLPQGGGAPVRGNTRARAFFLSLSFVAGMASVYSLLGMIAAMTGAMFGTISTSPWALLIIANFLLLFALNILEAVPFPAWLSGKPLKPAAGGATGAFVLGAASGLVASPCTSPVLFALLTFVAANQQVVYGGILLFAFSLGMGVLLIVAGTFSGLAATLPRMGRWSLGVKKLLGLLMLGMAEYYLIKAGQAWL
jgi:thiol:disulfide interchange protein DsbD